MEKGDDIDEPIIVRHGEPDHLINDFTGGWTDSRLTQLGKTQALQTGEYLAELIGDRQFGLYSSDLARAIETSELIAESLPIKPVLTPALRELNNGAAADLSNADAARIANPITQPLVDWYPYPESENWREMSTRVIEFLDKITDNLALLVMHGGSANAAIFWWFGIGIGEANISFELDPCSVSRFNLNRWGERNAIKINDTTHLK